MLPLLAKFAIVANLFTKFALAANHTEIHPKVINGEPVDIRVTFPSHVSLEYDGEIYCGGTVIGDRTIVTAAHCLEAGDKLKAVFSDGSSMKLSPSKYEIHPDYDNRMLFYDAGVIRTKNKIPSSIPRARLSTGPLKRDETLHVHGRGDTIEDPSPKHAGHKRKKGKRVAKAVAPGSAPGPVAEGDPKFLDDLVDWVGDAIDDAVDWGDDTFFGDYDEQYYYVYYDDVYYPEDEYGLEDEYDPEYIYYYDETYYPEEPLNAVMFYRSDGECELYNNIGNDPSSFCAVSDYQNICNGDSGGGIIRVSDGTLAGMVSTSTIGCDAIDGRYEATFTDLTNGRIREFVDKYLQKDQADDQPGDQPDDSGSGGEPSPVAPPAEFDPPLSGSFGFYSTSAIFASIIFSW